MSLDLLQTILIAVLTNGAVLAMFLWVFKVAFEKALDRSVKLSEKELELQHKKNFHRFSKLYDEQATVLRTTYAALIRLNEEASFLAYHYHFFEEHLELLEQYRLPKTGGSAVWDQFLKNALAIAPEDRRAEALTKEASQALRDFRPNRIYLEPAMADEVERLMNLFLYVGSEFGNVNYRDPDTMEQIIAPEVIETWKQASAASRALFPQLEESFRHHLVAVK